MLAENFVPEPSPRIVVALQFYGVDEARALRLARLIADLEPARRDDVIFAFCRRFDLPMSREVWLAALHVGGKFPVIHLASQREGVGHPDGCWSTFAGTMDQLSEGWASGTLRAHSALFIEADGVPLRKDWLDRIISAHRETLSRGKRVTGALTDEGVRHINGSLMAHLSLWADRPSLHRCPPGWAWDLHHAEVLMAEALPTTWIANFYGAGNWNPESLKIVSKEVAWLSSQKDDSAIAWAERTLGPR